MTARFDNAEILVDHLVEQVGKKLVVGLPVGIGKATHVANALYERACADSTLELTFFTGLTLVKPQASSDLEARLLDPLLERWFGAWPDPLYALALRDGGLPANVTVREFYLQAGAWLGNEAVQQSYTSINYSKVVDELVELGVNVIAQLVSVDEAAEAKFSLGGNPEVTLDLLPRLAGQRAQGKPIAVIGQVNRFLPYMGGDAELAANEFDFILDNPDFDFPLFGLPSRRVTAADYATGMHVASLVPDGGTLQVGIGSLSDAVAHCLTLRHERPALFAEVLARLPGGSRDDRRRELPVETRPFSAGLYSSTELLSDALFDLFERGILKRPAGEGDDSLVHAGFFVGSSGFYAKLAALPADRRQRISMTHISFVNSLYGDEQRKRRQRAKACFVNETMMVSLLGAAVSDGLEDGRVVSGIGGQFDFVQMASELQDARSVLMLRAWRMQDGVARSNVRWNYGHTSVPRQHRDIFVTEYGVASTRGKPDAAVIDAILAISDARFQASLARTAIEARKLPVGYRLPERARVNGPGALRAVFESDEFAASFPPYPLGTDLGDSEQKLVVALEWLKANNNRITDRLRTALGALLRAKPEKYMPELARLQLDVVGNLRERLLRRLVSHALEETAR